MEFTAYTQVGGIAYRVSVTPDMQLTLFNVEAYTQPRVPVQCTGGMCLCHWYIMQQSHAVAQWWDHVAQQQQGARYDRTSTQH